MGLLSDPEYGSARMVKMLKRVSNPLSFLCYVGAIVWFGMLAHKSFNNETYFSENALLPGLATNEFNGEASAKQYYNEFMLELEEKYYDIIDMPVPWLVGKMSQLHLEVYVHNFTLHYPIGEGQTFKGTNVYGILRAARASSLEAIVLSVPYRPLSSHDKGTAAGIALMLAFAQFARPQKYWAKDIIFLVTEHEQLGAQAWLEAYHGVRGDSGGTFQRSLGAFWSPHAALDLNPFGNRFHLGHRKLLDPGTLTGRAGSIQAAINLEFHTPKIKYVEVKVEGLNGQLPNLDLVNLVHKLCSKSGIHHSFKSSYSWIRTRDPVEAWTKSFTTMMEMVLTQLPGVPNGNHGLFHRFGIEAVTLEGREADDPAGSPPRVNALTTANFYRIGVALESIMRSLNNLLERFHQSYFFYLLAGTDRFISIGQYMPSLCLICVAMLIKSLALWVTIHSDEDEVELTNNQEKVPGDKTTKGNEKALNKADGIQSEEEPTESDEKVPGEKKDEETNKVLKKVNTKIQSDAGDLTEKVPADKKLEGAKKVLKKADSNISVLYIGMNFLVVHAIGYAVMLSPVLLSQLGVQYFDAPSEKSIFFGLAAISAVIVVFSPVLLLIRPEPITFEELTLTNALVLIEAATVCLNAGMHNFPLGLAMGVALCPMALCTAVVVTGKGGMSTCSLYLRRALCLLSHPLSVAVCALTASGAWLFREEGVAALSRGPAGAQQATMFAVIDSMIYGNWLFNVSCCLLLPIWMINWQILNITAETKPIPNQ